MKPIITHDTEITDATISGIMRADGIVEWYINIEAGTIEVDGYELRPQLYIERLKWDIKSFEDLLNKSIHINDSSEFSNNMILPGVQLCCLYCIRTWLYQWQLIFIVKKMLYIKWNGYSKEYEVNLDISIEFLGINLGDIEIEDATKRLKFDKYWFVFL